MLQRGHIASGWARGADTAADQPRGATSRAGKPGAALTPAGHAVVEVVGGRFVRAMRGSPRSNKRQYGYRCRVVAVLRRLKLRQESPCLHR